MAISSIVSFYIRRIHTPITVDVNDLTVPRGILNGFNLVAGRSPKVLYFPGAFRVGGGDTTTQQLLPFLF